LVAVPGFRETLQSLAREDKTAKRYLELLEEPGRGWYRVPE
jgi:hypothetical protein